MVCRRRPRLHLLTTTDSGHPVTPDGRYFVIRGRLWRTSDPRLSDERRADLVRELMAARSAKGHAATDAAREAARARVDAAKRALGERGPVWWDDGAPDWNRHLAKNTPYADWYARLPEQSPPIAGPR